MVKKTIIEYISIIMDDEVVGATVCNLDISRLQGKLEAIANANTGSFHFVSDQNGVILANTIRRDKYNQKFLRSCS